MVGRYPGLCHHDWLTPDQLTAVAAAEQRNESKAAPAQAVAPARTARRVRSANGCEAGHWVESVSDDGGIVKLEDGTIWEIDPADTVDTALWLATTDIVACNDKLINTEDNESADATRLR
jgi:hypothetical protein